MSRPSDDRVPVGKIVGTFGVRGEVKLESWTDPRESIFSYQPWLLVRDDGPERVVRHVDGRKQGKGLVAVLESVTDRDAALALVGTAILIARSQLPALDDETYYWADLEGMSVVNGDGVDLGQVERMLATGANDVMVVRGGQRERLIPFVTGWYVRNVDMECRRITVDWDPED